MWDVKTSNIFVFEVVYTGHGPDVLILRGPASCRRCSKQGAKTNRLFIVFVYISQTQKWLQLCSRLWWIITTMKKILTVWMTTMIGVLGEEAPKKVTFWTNWPRGWLGLLFGKGKETCFCMDQVKYFLQPSRCCDVFIVWEDTFDMAGFVVLSTFTSSTLPWPTNKGSANASLSHTDRFLCSDINGGPCKSNRRITEVKIQWRQIVYAN